MNNILNTKKQENSAMPQKSLKKNFILSNIRLVLSFLLPLVTFPYVSRVLGSSSVGKVSFANSIVSYFVLFTALGIPAYGVREVARVRDDKTLLSKTVAELSVILSITVLIGYAVYFLLILFVPVFKSDFILYLIIAPTIFLSDFSYEWFYQGIEDQSYITIRYIIIKILQLSLIFTLVKKTDDYSLYSAILVGMNCLSSLFNIVHLRKYICFVPLKKLEIKRHLKPIIVIFASVIAISVYTQLDVTMTGIFCGDKEVGVYTAANRVVRIVISIVTSLSLVIVPKIENALKNKRIEEYQNLLNTSLSFTLSLSIPCVLGILILADDIIQVFAGNEFIDSIFSIRLLCPIIIIVGLASFVGPQILYANRKEKYYTIAVSIAAVVNFISNMIFIPLLGQIGAVIGTLIAEITGLLIMSFLGRKILYAANLKVSLWKYIIATVGMSGTVFLLKNFLQIGKVLRLLICVLCGIIVYVILLAFLKETLISRFMSDFKEKLKK